MKKATSIGISCVAIQKNNYYDFFLLVCYFYQNQLWPMGASIYYVRKIFGILDPLPPLRSHFTQPISPVIRKFGQFFNPPPPLGANVINGSPLREVAWI